MWPHQRFRPAVKLTQPSHAPGDHSPYETPLKTCCHKCSKSVMIFRSASGAFRTPMVVNLPVWGNNFARLRPPRQTLNDIPGEHMKWIHPSTRVLWWLALQQKQWERSLFFLHRCRNCAACSIDSCGADNQMATSHNAGYIQRRGWTNRWEQTFKYDIGDNQWTQLSATVEWVARLRQRGSDTEIENARQTTHRHTVHT